MIRIISGAIAALGLIPFALAIWVLLTSEDFSAEFVSTYILCGIAFFALGTALHNIFGPRRDALPK